LHGFSFGRTGGLSYPGKRDSIAMLDNVVGEWEKEGFGRGLEERLDVLVIQPAVDSPVVSPVWFLGFRGRLLRDVSKRGEWNGYSIVFLLFSFFFPFFFAVSPYILSYLLSYSCRT
jgi:hypothetical protein